MAVGVGVKRWLLLGGIGIAIFSLGIAYLLVRGFSFRPAPIMPVAAEAAIAIAVGAVTMGLAVYGLYRVLAPVVFARTSFDTMAHTISTRRVRERGPKIVAVGGGTGLSVLLRGLKEHTDNLSAIITVADDGGSSGRLRKELGLLPPGDFRNCLVALSDAEKTVTDLFQYRFQQGQGLEGHSFGNLFIAAMTEVTGSFEAALYESSRVLAVRGQILPATLSDLKLSARLKDGSIILGESNITTRGGQIEQLFIEPGEPVAYPAAVQAILSADLIVIGPGSLYTSILPNLLVPGIREAVRDTHAARVYVCNVATQVGETEGYAVADHLEALQRNTFRSIVDFVIANSEPKELGPRFLGKPVVHDGRPLGHARLVQADLMDTEHPVRHDSGKLAQAVLDVYHGRRKSKLPLPKSGGTTVAAGTPR
jgi:uncharacterized cofD-like protein